MTERPILFSGPMVRAILEGRKTQTRRVVKRNAAGRAERGGRNWHLDDPDAVKACPYGAPGDRLWVRENGWQRPERTPRMMREGADTWARYYYDADGEDGEQLKEWGFKRRPSIHMPRWACRLVLEVTAVRVERLQEISEADAIAEGIERTHIDSLGRQQYRMVPHCEYDIDEGQIIGAAEYVGRTTTPKPVDAYRALWLSLNAKRAPWASNPWVWVVEFRQCAAPSTTARREERGG